MNNALQVINSMDRGRAAQELQEAMAAVAKAVLDVRAKGEVTLKIKINPSGDAVELVAEVTSKIPKPGLKAATFFVEESGELTREDPNQREFPEVVQMQQPTTAAVNPTL